MEVSELSKESLQTIIETVTCREDQIRQLAQILCVGKCHMSMIQLTCRQSNLPSPPLLVVHGVQATGKSTVAKEVLKGSSDPSAIIPSPECITTRHLLERTLDSVKESLEEHNEDEVPETDGRCESLSIFVVELQRLLANRRKFILVFDAIDRQREPSPTLLPALSRLGEIIPTLSVVLILTTPHPQLLHQAGVPHLHFPQYTRADTISIITAFPLPVSAHPIKNSPDPTSTSSDSDSAWLWTRFVTACYDSLGAAAARDLPSFRRLCQTLWPAFVAPILDKGEAPGDYWPREFSKLIVKNRPLFQNETALVPSIIPQELASISANTTTVPATPINLPYHAAFLLIASYLASHNPARTDLAMFSKTSLGKKRKRRGTPNHSKNKLKTHQKLSRRLLGPQPFGLERLFAIFHAIASDDGYRGGSAGIMGQVTTLVGLRLMVRAGNAGGGMGDALEGSGKWKCAVGWDFVKGVSREYGFVLDDYVVD